MYIFIFILQYHMYADGICRQNYDKKLRWFGLQVPAGYRPTYLVIMPKADAYEKLHLRR